MTRHIVARTGDIPSGGNKVVGIEGRDIVVFHLNGEFFALRRNHPQEYRAKMHEATRLKWETRLITFGGVALGSAGLALMVMAPTKRAPKAERPDEAPSPTGGT